VPGAAQQVAKHVGIYAIQSQEYSRRVLVMIPQVVDFRRVREQLCAAVEIDGNHQRVRLDRFVDRYPSEDLSVDLEDR